MSLYTLLSRKPDGATAADIEEALVISPHFLESPLIPSIFG